MAGATGGGDTGGEAVATGSGGVAGAGSFAGRGATAAGGGFGAETVAGGRCTAGGATGTGGIDTAGSTGDATAFTLGGVTRRGAASGGVLCGRDTGNACQILTDALERTFCCQFMLMNRAPMNTACKATATTPAATGIGSESASLRNHAVSRIGSIVPRVPTFSSRVPGAHGFGTASSPTLFTRLRWSRSMVCRTRSYLISLSAVMMTG